MPASISKFGEGSKQAASNNYARTEDNEQQSLYW
jgi:hypothetical protein